MIEKRIIREWMAQNDSDGTCDGTLKLISFNGKLIDLSLNFQKERQSSVHHLLELDRWDHIWYILNS